MHENVFSCHVPYAPLHIVYLLQLFYLWYVLLLRLTQYLPIWIYIAKRLSVRCMGILLYYAN